MQFLEFLMSFEYFFNKFVLEHPHFSETMFCIKLHRHTGEGVQKFHLVHSGPKTRILISVMQSWCNQLPNGGNKIYPANLITATRCCDNAHKHFSPHFAKWHKYWLSRNQPSNWFNLTLAGLEKFKNKNDQRGPERCETIKNRKN